jgi:hypothetical protein
MPSQSRFVKSIIATSKAQEVRMPWTRGATRKAMIARRRAKAAETAATQTAKAA